ncbi:MAG: hypothetical protein FWF97_04835, partial [Alphaproteobacteria bacterium]|nr:hypothetical protein [Alphaproteobacteria bacterium]
MRYLKLLLLSLSLLLVMPVAHAAEIANVEYVHKYLETQTGLTATDIPIRASNVKEAVNVDYVLYLVDRANKVLTGTATNYYGLNVSNKMHAADTIAVKNAVDSLIEEPWNACGKTGFCIQLSNMKAGDIFDFQISAAGIYNIDWGDGTVETKTKNDTEPEKYAHTYKTAKNYRAVKISGLATGYNTGTSVAAISFENSTNKGKITAIAGSIGKIFPILSNTSKPRFVKTFAKLNGITSIPGELFEGIQGGSGTFGPASYMFDSTFACDIKFPDAWDTSWRTDSKLAGEIPENLFSEITGAPAPYMFNSTFDGCMKLTGIGGPLFAGIRGAPAEGMYKATFRNCRGLTGIGPDGTGTIPRGLFGNFDNGAPAPWMFAATFFGCKGFCGEIPGNLFQGMKGRPAKGMFFETFRSSFSHNIPVGDSS